MMTEPRPLPDRISGFRSGVINGLIDFCETLRPINSRTVWHTWTPGGIIPEAAAPSAEFDLSLLDYWYSITGANTLHVNGGKVPILGSNITVAAKDVDCPGTDTGALYVYMEVVVGEKTAAIIASAVSSEPVTELGVVRRVLYEIHKASGSIVIDAIRITDPWLLPVFVE